MIISVVPLPASLPSIYAHAISGIILSHVAHLLSAILLYFLALEIMPYKFHQRTKVAFTAAVLHVLSPAGLFLSAPFGESTFALLNFAGMLCYASASSSKIFEPNASTEATWTIVAGLCFGLASMIRGNGLLSGLVFACDAVLSVPKLHLVVRSSSDIIRLAGTIIAGSCVAIGFALPQYVAYQEYCLGGHTRPWCASVPPSVYSWVQDEYWNVGFLRYWILSNLPLFLLALPMLIVLATTAAMTGLHYKSALASSDATAASGPEGTKARLQDRTLRLFTHCIFRFALPQLALAGLAFTTFHVQIINRISSGYPVWYMVLAMVLHASEAGQTTDVLPGLFSMRGINKRSTQWIVRAMVMYAVVQGGLYASFLPPA